MSLYFLCLTLAKWVIVTASTFLLLVVLVALLTEPKVHRKRPTDLEAS